MNNTAVRYKLDFKNRKGLLLELPTEGWVLIDGFTNNYYLAHPSGYIKSVNPNRKPKAILGSHDKEGYSEVTLRKDNVPVKRKIHRLIAETFIPNPKNKPQVNHLDFDKTNNAASNLCWATSQEDADHKVKAGRQFKKY